MFSLHIMCVHSSNNVSKALSWAATIIQMVGVSSSLILSLFTIYHRFGTDYLPAVIDGLSCSLRSNYLTIFQCFYNTLGISSSCSDSSDVSVTCCKCKNSHCTQKKDNFGLSIEFILCNVNFEIIILQPDFHLTYDVHTYLSPWPYLLLLNFWQEFAYKSDWL